MLLNLLAGKVRTLGVKNLATALKDLNLALATAGLTTAGRGEEDAILIQGSHQTTALADRQLLVAIDSNGNIATGAEIALGYQQNNYKKEYYQQKDS